MSTHTPYLILPMPELIRIVDSSPGKALAAHPTVRDMAATFGMTPEAVAHDLAAIRETQRPEPRRPLDLSAYIIGPEPTRPTRRR